MAEFSRSRITRIISVPYEVRLRLQELGLDLVTLEEVGLAWMRGFSSASLFEPSTAAGLKGWIAATGVFREAQKLFGFEIFDFKNCPLTVNPKTGHAFTVTSGDNVTGLILDGMQPSTKNPKGSTAVAAIARNMEQLSFPLIPAPTVQAKAKSKSKRGQRKKMPPTWFVLAFLEKDGVRMEVSFPDEIRNKKIVHWSERIILPKVTRLTEGDRDTSSTGGQAPIDVPITRKAAS